jgi:hypothetical protein
MFLQFYFIKNNYYSILVSEKEVINNDYTRPMLHLWQGHR